MPLYPGAISAKIFNLSISNEYRYTSLLLVEAKRADLIPPQKESVLLTKCKAVNGVDGVGLSLPKPKHA